MVVCQRVLWQYVNVLALLALLHANLHLLLCCHSSLGQTVLALALGVACGVARRSSEAGSKRLRGTVTDRVLRDKQRKEEEKDRER